MARILNMVLNPPPGLTPREYCKNLPIKDLYSAAVSGIFEKNVDDDSLQDNKSLARRVLFEHRLEEFVQWLKENQEINFEGLPVEWIEKALGWEDTYSSFNYLNVSRNILRRRAHERKS